MSSSVGLMNLPAVDLAAQTRHDFPLLAQKACLGQPLLYLDHAATSQKPRQVPVSYTHLTLPTICSV